GPRKPEPSRMRRYSSPEAHSMQDTPHASPQPTGDTPWRAPHVPCHRDREPDGHLHDLRRTRGRLAIASETGRCGPSAYREQQGFLRRRSDGRLPEQRLHAADGGENRELEGGAPPP